MGYEIRAKSFTEVLDTAFRLLRDHFRILVGVAATVNVPLAYLTASPVFARGPENWAGLVLLLCSAGLLVLLTVVGMSIVYAAVTYIVAQVHLGRSVTWREAVARARSLLLRLVGTSLLYTLFVAAGLLALIVPGVHLIVAYMLVWPVILVEQTTGRAALRRSRMLMRGSWWRGFGIYVISALIVGTLQPITELLLGGVPVLGPLGGGLAGAVGLAYGAAVTVVLYFDLRSRVDAFDLEHLAAQIETAAAAPG